MESGSLTSGRREWDHGAAMCDFPTHTVSKHSLSECALLHPTKALLAFLPLASDPALAAANEAQAGGPAVKSLDLQQVPGVAGGWLSGQGLTTCFWSLSVAEMHSTEVEF